MQRFFFLQLEMQRLLILLCCKSAREIASRNMAFAYSNLSSLYPWTSSREAIILKQ